MLGSCHTEHVLGPHKYPQIRAFFDKAFLHVAAVLPSGRALTATRAVLLSGWAPTSTRAVRSSLPRLGPVSPQALHTCLPHPHQGLSPFCLSFASPVLSWCWELDEECKRVT